MRPGIHALAHIDHRHVVAEPGYVHAHHQRVVALLRWSAHSLIDYVGADESVETLPREDSAHTGQHKVRVLTVGLDPALELCRVGDRHRSGIDVAGDPISAFSKAVPEWPLRVERIAEGTPHDLCLTVGCDWLNRVPNHSINGASFVLYAEDSATRIVQARE